MSSNKQPLITPPKEAKLDLSESTPPNSMSNGSPNKRYNNKYSKIMKTMMMTMTIVVFHVVVFALFVVDQE